jgi:hypothetical protein
MAVFSLLASCELDESVEVLNPKTTEFTRQIQDYLDNIPLQETKGIFFTVDVVKDNIDYQSVEAVVLNEAQTLLIATLGNITNNDKITTSKIVFYLQKNGIKKAKVFTFENNTSLTSYNNTIKYMLSNENDKISYSGEVSIYSENGLFQFAGTLDNGKLLKNEQVYPKFQSSLSKLKAGGERCLSWYRVVKVGEVIISATYLYTTCQGGGDSTSGGSGSSGSSTGPWVILPEDPDDKTLHTHIDENGLITEYIYEKAKQIWHIIQVTIPEVMVYAYPKYQFLGNINFPSHGQIVIGDQNSYQYNTYTGSWVEKPIVLLEDPCASLKKSTTNTEYTGRIQTLLANTTNSDHKERGHKELLDGTFVPLTNGSNGANNHSLDFEVDSNTKGYLHNHNNPYPDGTYDDEGNPNMVTPIHMPSPADIIQFLQIVVKAHFSSTPLSDVYGTMVSSSGNYTLKYSGIYPANFNFNNENIKEKYLIYFDKEKNTEKAFLLFLKEKIGIQGLELYKVAADGTTEKKSLNATNTVQNTPCNN